MLRGFPYSINGVLLFLFKLIQYPLCTVTENSHLLLQLMNRRGGRILSLQCSYSRIYFSPFPLENKDVLIPFPISGIHFFWTILFWRVFECDLEYC